MRIMEPKRRKKLIFDAFAIVLFILLPLVISRPWIFHPLTRSIGSPSPTGGYEPVFSFGNPDVIMNLTFCAWPKFALTQLHTWPLARTKYLMFPQGASHGVSFDGLMLALITSLLWCFLPLPLAFNIGLLLGLFLCGFTFYRLCCRLWGRGLLALGLGVSALCMPFLSQRLECHPNLLYIWTIPLAIHLFFNFISIPLKGVSAPVVPNHGDGLGTRFRIMGP